MRCWCGASFRDDPTGQHLQQQQQQQQPTARLIAANEVPRAAHDAGANGQHAWQIAFFLSTTSRW